MKKLICLVLAVMLALSAVSALASEYSDKDTVKKVQQALNDAGYDCGTPDGTAGKKTKAAITSYQTDKGLTVSGVMDDELLVALGLAEAETAEEAPAEAETAEVEETAEANEGYTFQGIPWGSSPEEVKEILVANGLIDAEARFSTEAANGNPKYYPNIDNFNVMELPDAIGAGFNCTVNGAGGEISVKLLKSVGGIEPASSVDFDFIYETKNDEITTNLQLIRVGIFFGHNEAAFGALSEKLTQAYGKYSENSENVFNTRMWMGENQTVIALASSAGLVFLTYAKADAYEQVEAIQALLAANKAPVADAGL